MLLINYLFAGICLTAFGLAPKQNSSPGFSRSEVMNKHNHASCDDGAQEYARARIVEDAQGEKDESEAANPHRKVDEILHRTTGVSCQGQLNNPPSWPQSYLATLRA